MILKRWHSPCYNPDRPCASTSEIISKDRRDCDSKLWISDKMFNIESYLPFVRSAFINVTFIFLPQHVQYYLCCVTWVRQSDDRKQTFWCRRKEKSWAECTHTEMMQMFDWDRHTRATHNVDKDVLSLKMSGGITFVCRKTNYKCKMIVMLGFPSSTGGLFYSLKGKNEYLSYKRVH